MGQPSVRDAIVSSIQGLGALAERFGIRLVIQFGSTVSGTSHKKSDLDVAAKLIDPDVSLQTMLDIQAAFQVLFPGSDIDLAILNRADPLFLKKILESGRLLYGNEKEFARLRLSAFKQYQDFRPYLELERRYVARRLAALCSETSRP